MAKKNVMFVIFVVLLMITTVSLTGCMGAGTAPATSVAGVAVSGANTATDEYPFLEVGKPRIVNEKCWVKQPDRSLKRCTEEEVRIAIVYPSYSVK
jgi:hypothetical protein